MNDKQSSAASADSTDALDLLMADHRAVEKLFDAFERSEERAAETRGALVQRACEELTIHTMIEEELLYPAAKEALAQQQTEIEEAYVEHFLVKTLIAKFETLKPDDAGFNATFRVLAEMVQHHVEEEESQLFPALRRSGLDRTQLGARIAHRKEQLTAQLEAAGSRLVGDMTFAASPADIGGGLDRTTASGRGTPRHR